MYMCRYCVLSVDISVLSVGICVLSVDMCVLSVDIVLNIYTEIHLLRCNGRGGNEHIVKIHSMDSVKQEINILFLNALSKT